MRIVNLVENTPGVPGCGYEHGLSFYIETKKHKILADSGATDIFLHNAETLGIDLTAVDIMFLSHGHYGRLSATKRFRFRACRRPPWINGYKAPRATRLCGVSG